MPFQPGVSANPGGRTPSTITWRKFSDRSGELLERYDYEKILELDDAIRKRKKVPLSSFDCIIIKNLAAIYNGEGKERERFFDRLWGKAVQRIGGENPGEGIKVNHTGFLTENLDSESLLELAEAVERVKSRVIDAQFVEVPDCVPAQAQLEQPERGE